MENSYSKIENEMREKRREYKKMIFHVIYNILEVRRVDERV